MIRRVGDVNAGSRLIPVRVEVAEVTNRETIELCRKVLPHDVVVPDFDAFGIPLPAPEEPCQLEDGSNCRLDGMPVFRVKEVNTLTGYLRLMIAFDSEALSHVNSPQAFFESCAIVTGAELTKQPVIAASPADRLK